MLSTSMAVMANGVNPAACIRGAFHVLMADGAVRFISENIDTTTRTYLAKISDGNPVGDF